MKVVRYKDSLLRHGIDIYGLIQLPNEDADRNYVCIFGLEFWRGQSLLGTDMIFYSKFNVREEGALFASSIDPNWTYVLLPDYQYEIFNNLELVGECTQNLFLTKTKVITPATRIDIDWSVLDYLENKIRYYENRTLQTWIN